MGPLPRWRGESVDKDDNSPLLSFPSGSLQFSERSLVSRLINYRLGPILGHPREGPVLASHGPLKTIVEIL